MKGFFLGLAVLIAGGAFMGLPTPTQAHPGNTDSQGCHTCRTNCPDWGLSYGEYHCHNSRGVSQPESPIRSHYGAGGTGSTEYWPEYEYGGSNTQPTCPIFSRYDSLSETCECNYGYVVQNGSCVNGNTVCHQKHGYNSNYEDHNNSCTCDYGYKLDSGGQCVSRDDYCEDIHGPNAEYNILEASCVCKDGYVNDGTNSCVLADSLCREEFGLFSEYDSYKEECVCNAGYEFNGNICVRIEIEYDPPTPVVEVPIEKAPTQIVQTEPEILKPVETPQEESEQMSPEEMFQGLSQETVSTPDKKGIFNSLVSVVWGWLGW